MAISDNIRNRIIENNKRFNANDNISDFIKPGELELLQKEVSEKFQSVLNSLIIDTENDWNTKDTANRIAKMFIQEIFSGRYKSIPKITDFPNVGYDQMYISGPITIRSTCSHHMMPIVGNCWIGIHPGTKVIGLSKFNRICEWIANRPQIQEELTEQIANTIEQVTDPKGVAVIIKATHFCMTHRGVREHKGIMTTSVMRGEFRDKAMLRNEFLTLVNNTKET